MHRSRFEARLKDTNLKLRLAIRAAQIGTWEWDLKSGQMEYSPRARAICGLKPDEDITIDKVRAITHPDDLPRTSEMARRALAPDLRENPVYEYRICRADTGEVRWVLAHGEAIFARVDDVPTAVRYLGTIVDITDRKSHELALEESARQLRLAIEGARMAIWEVDLRTDAISHSPELNRLFGLPDNARPSLAELRSFYAPGERERVRQIALDALNRNETRFEAEFRSRRQDGQERWLLLRAEVLKEPGSEATRVVGILMDIDDRKRGEDRQTLMLRELNHRVKNTLGVVQAIANQNFRGRSDPVALENFQARLRSLSEANAVLLEREYQDFELSRLIENLVAPYRDPADRIVMEGENIALPPRLTIPLALVVHELCTNAAKYGALARPEGRVSIVWKQYASSIELVWAEEGGPAPQTSAPSGFGMRLITEILAPQIGDVNLSLHPTGLTCHLRIDVSG